MNLTAAEEIQIRHAVEAVDDNESVAVLKGDVAGLDQFWAADLLVNAPHNRVSSPEKRREFMMHGTGLQYSSFERHREAMVIRPTCAVTMGYEVVVPKGDVPDARKTIHRRYTNIYFFDDGGWRMIGRQATNISVN
jgi:hypothetical protein